MIAAVLAVMLRAQMAWAEFPVTVFVAANVARCESSARYDDGAAVLQTALNRAKAWRRSLLSVLTQRRQFAWDCPVWPRTPALQHLRMGVAAALGTLRAPEWAAGSFEYLGPSDRAELTATRGPEVGRLVHTFHGPRAPAAGVAKLAP